MRLFRISNFLSLGLATFFGVLLFWTSQSVQVKEDELAEARKSLTHEQDTVRVLSVEWDYLNRPQRLEKLAIEHLGMELPTGKEVVKDVSDIPEPEVFEEPMIQNASIAPAAPAPVAIPKKETIVPSTTEKQSFDKLIQSLDGEGQ